MKKALIAIVLLVILLAGAAVIVPNFIDWSKYKTQILAKLHDATGYEFTVNGELQMRVLPAPHLVVGDLAVFNPAQPKTPILTLAKADVSVALLPLLSRKIVLNSVTLDRPQIHLGTLADGTPNWQTAIIKEKIKAGGDKSGNRTGGQGIALEKVDIENGAFVYDGANKVALSAVNLNLHADTLDGPFTANGGFTYGKQPIKFNAKAGKIDREAQTVSLQAEITAPAQATLTYAGVVGFGAAPQAQGMTEISAGNIGRLIALATGGAAPAGLARICRRRAC